MSTIRTTMWVDPSAVRLTAPADIPTYGIVDDTAAVTVAFGTATTNLGFGIFRTNAFTTAVGRRYTVQFDGDPLGLTQVIAGDRYKFVEVDGDEEAAIADITVLIAAVGLILADTAAMEPLVSTNLNATVSSRAQPGDAMALTAGAESQLVDATWDEILAGGHNIALSAGAQVQHIEKVVYYDPSVAPGGIGTSDDPIDNEASLRTRADAIGSSDIIARGAIVLSQDWRDFRFRALNRRSIVDSVDPGGFSVDGCFFEDITLTGSGDAAPLPADSDFVVCKNCNILSISNVKGDFIECIFLGTCSLSLGSQFISGRGSTLFAPTFDFPNGGQSQWADYSGPLILGTFGPGIAPIADLSGSSMDVTLSASVSAGTVSLVGSGSFIDNKTGGTVNLNGFNAPISKAGQVTTGATTTTIPTTITGLGDDNVNNLQLRVYSAAGDNFIAVNVEDYDSATGTFTVLTLPFTPADDDPIQVAVFTGSTPGGAGSAVIRGHSVDPTVAP